MDKGKGVRKYGRLRQSLRWGRYILHRCLLLPVKVGAGCICFYTALGFLAVSVFLLCAIVVRLFGLSTAPDFGILPGVLLVLIFCGGIAFGTGWFLRYSNFKAPKGTILNPRRPEENPLLPDEELLVRPSSSSAAQPAELLRAATETTEEKPEELLRAGNN